MSSAPVKYVRVASYTDFSASHPEEQQPGASLDGDFNGLKTVTDKLVDRLAEVQRDDGKVKNGVVTPESLSPDVLGMLTILGATPRGAWLTGTNYAVRDVVAQGGGSYAVMTAHVSGVFATDLAAGKLMVLSVPTSNQTVNTTDSPTFASLTLTAALTVAGQSKFSAGTYAAPSMSFAADTNTGFYNVAPDAIGVSCGGVAVMTFNGNGSVVGATTFAKGEVVTVVGNTNNLLGPIANYSKYLLFLSWNGGSGFALLAIAVNGAVTMLGSSNALGGDNAFDNVNNFASNGGNGLSLVTGSSIMYIQAKASYAAGNVTVHRFGG